MATPDGYVDIEITIDEDGKVRIEGFGFEGDTCLKEMKFLEKAFPKGRIKKKKEFFKKAPKRKVKLTQKA